MIQILYVKAKTINRPKDIRKSEKEKKTYLFDAYANYKNGKFTREHFSTVQIINFVNRRGLHTTPTTWKSYFIRQFLACPFLVKEIIIFILILRYYITNKLHVQTPVKYHHGNFFTIMQYKCILRYCHSDYFLQ